MLQLKNSPNSYGRPKKTPETLVNFLSEQSANQTIVLSEEQTGLTRNFLTEDLQSELQLLVSDLRRKTDRQILSSFSDDDFEGMLLPGIKHPALYPLGYCDEIRDQVWNRLFEWLKENNSAPLTCSLRKFITSGGLLNVVHGVVSINDFQCFQNSIQLGSLIIDCAADAGTSSECEPVKVHSVDNGVFSNIDSFSQYYEVARKYWGVRLIPTARYFPHLAPLFPEIMLLADGDIIMPVFKDLFFRNIRDNFRLSEEYLATRAPSRFQLPSRWRKALAKSYAEQNSILAYRQNDEPSDHYFDLFRRYVKHNARSKNPDNQHDAVNFLRRLSTFGSSGF